MLAITLQGLQEAVILYNKEDRTLIGLIFAYSSQHNRCKLGMHFGPGVGIVRTTATDWHDLTRDQLLSIPFGTEVPDRRSQVAS